MSDDLEHCVELSCHNIPLHLGRCSSEHSLSEEAKPSKVVPEYVLAWAIGQFLRVREIANENDGKFDTLGCV